MFIVYDLDCLSESELWEIAINRYYDSRIRQEAMVRFLFPADYGYTWASERLQSLKKLTQSTNLCHLQMPHTTDL
jgi:hypothetical protein